MKKLLIILLILSACKNIETERSYPKDTGQKQREKYGSLTGGDNGGGGINLLNIGEGKKSDEYSVNSALWQASLDVLSFMPLIQADKASGVIITDWYEDPDAKGEKFKINAVVKPGELSANSVKITMFKQVQGKNGTWRNTGVSEKLIASFEEKILARTREIKVKYGKE